MLIVHIAGQGLGFSVKESDAKYNLTKLSRAIDVSQHHDCIIDAETADVRSNNFMYMAGTGTERLKYFSESIAGKFLSKSSDGGPSLIHNGKYLLSITLSNQVILILYNSLTWTSTNIIKSTNNKNDLIIYDNTSNLLESQINPIAQLQPFKDPRKNILYILINDILPLLTMTLFIQQNNQLTNVGKVMSRRTFNAKAEASDGLGETEMRSGGCTFAWYDGMFDSSSFFLLFMSFLFYIFHFVHFIMKLDDVRYSCDN